MLLHNYAITFILRIMDRREYEIETIIVNRVKINRVVIDPHYEAKHGDHMNDELILELVNLLNHRIVLPEAKDEEGYSYFSSLLELEKKQYRLVWLLETWAIYIGVVNVYRDDRRS